MYVLSSLGLDLKSLVTLTSAGATLVAALLFGGNQPTPAQPETPSTEQAPATGSSTVRAMATFRERPTDPSVAADTIQAIADAAHLNAFYEDRFPSANTCATCHPGQYREWSVSQHAYAQMSPVFNAMHGTILKLTNGTNGDFCIRCHTPVGMNIGEPEFMSNMDRFATSREGITCIVCHRLKNPYGKVSGRLAIVEGDLFDPVYGPQGNAEVERVVDSDSFRVNTVRGNAGRAIHTQAIEFEQIDTPALCGTCHDVNLVNGFRLEEAFSDYKSSPASSNGVTCQDCHMGKGQGVNEGYEIAPAARVGGVYTKPRKRTDHMFAGPDYSIIHPGIFPHNVEAAELATIREWLQFDHEAGWGTIEFEDNIPEGYTFPEKWQFPDDRFDARDIIEDNKELLDEMEEKRMDVLQAGYRLGEIEVNKSGPDGLEFEIDVSNGTDGHSVPTGFDAERLVFLQVTVTDSDGDVVFVSGDRDPNGDVRDLHSIYVHNGEIKQDKQLFSLQSKFIVRMNRGGEREQVLALNYSPDPLPFLRPSTRSTVLLARPVGARKHRKVLPPLASKTAKYKVDGDKLEGTSGPYTVNIKMIAQMIPVNLVHEIQGVGFDYFMSPREIAEGVVDGAQVLWEREAEL